MKKSEKSVKYEVTNPELAGILKELKEIISRYEKQGIRAGSSYQNQKNLLVEERIARLSVDLIEKPGIQTLDLSGTNLFADFGRDSEKKEMRLFYEALKSNNTIKKINLSGTELSGKSLWSFVRALGNNNLEEINVSNNRGIVSRGSYGAFVGAIRELAEHKTLKSVDLSKTGAADYHNAISDLINKNPLKEINLLETNITPQCLVSISKAIQGNNTLKRIDLSNIQELSSPKTEVTNALVEFAGMLESKSIDKVPIVKIGQGGSGVPEQQKLINGIHARSAEKQQLVRGLKASELIGTELVRKYGKQEASGLIGVGQKPEVKKFKRGDTVILETLKSFESVPKDTRKKLKKECGRG